MAHIQLDNDFPGIVGLMFHKPHVGRAIADLSQALLRGPSPLSPAERELIAAHVSKRNECDYCRSAHAATAAVLSGDGAAVACVVDSGVHESVSKKMRALLHIAGLVQRSGRNVTSTDVAAARAEGADDDEIHDAVAIAAAFCFFNRYVDGLGTTTPTDPAFYEDGGKFLAKAGYRRPSAIGRFFIGRMMKKLRANPPERAAG
jgi:uncharacterized peroxidase-related enzyme